MGDSSISVPDWGSLPFLCWIKIFQYAGKPDDIILLSSLFPDVRRMLKGTGFLLDEMDRANWTNKTDYVPRSLKWRLINHHVKSQVELNYSKFWMGQDDINFLPPYPYQFADGEKIQKFLEHFSHHPKNRSPFIVPICQVTPSSSRSYGKGIQLLSTFGEGIHHADLGFGGSATPQKALQMLQEMISHVRNVESLAISMKFVPHVLGKVPTAHQPFPELPHLKNLNLKRISTELEARSELIAPLVSSLLLSFGCQISKFSCGEQAFQVGLGVETWNLFENLEFFRIDFNTNFSDWDLKKWNNVLEPLAQVKWLRLREFKLKCCGYKRIPFTSGLMKAIGNFRNSLQTLYLDGIPKQLKESVLDITNVAEFPKVENFSIRQCNWFETFPPTMWEVFGNQIPNLKVLQFLLDYETCADLENPEFYFELFNKLEEINVKRVAGLILRSFSRNVDNN